jgi:hypothetical protein
MVVLPDLVFDADRVIYVEKLDGSYPNATARLRLDHGDELLYTNEPFETLRGIFLPPELTPLEP